MISHSNSNKFYSKKSCDPKKKLSTPELTIPPVESSCQVGISQSSFLLSLLPTRSFLFFKKRRKLFTGRRVCPYEFKQFIKGLITGSINVIRPTFKVLPDCSADANANRTYTMMRLYGAWAFSTLTKVIFFLSLSLPHFTFCSLIPPPPHLHMLCVSNPPPSPVYTHTSHLLFFRLVPKKIYT